MNIKSFWALESLIALVMIGLAALLFLGIGGLRVNLTSSLPKGVYRLTDETPERGDFVTFCLESSNPFCGVAKERGYLITGACPSGLQPLLKRLAGLPGDSVEITLNGLVLNSSLLPGTVRPERDSHGRPVPPSLLSGGPIPDGQALVLSQTHAGSFDSRHFGLVSFDALKKVKPVFIME